jgi:hypothetical protein
MHPMLRYLFLFPIILLLPACSTHLQQKEQFLTEAGFRAVTPVTQAQSARVNSLPQGHITQITRNGKTLFMLADARRNLLLVGGNTQLERYQHLLYKKEIDPAIANEKAIRLEQSEWGPWEDFYGPFGPMMPY